MTAFFPNRIRRFPVHRNLIDDVDADHINAIQDELHAVMFALGQSPQVYNNIEVDATTSTALPNDDGSVVSDEDVYFTSSLRYFDPKQKPIDHGTVGARLDDIERGAQFHAFALRANHLDISSSSVNLSDRPRAVRMPKPSSTDDPFSMHNGVGVTLRKSGFWMFSGSAIFTLQGATASSNDGIYQATIDVDKSYLDGMDRDELSGSFKHPSLRPSLMGFFPRGARVSLRAAQNSGRGQKIRRAALSGVLIKETIEG